MIVYTCPKCGSELINYVLTSYPPIYVTKCSNCDWETRKSDKIIKIPYNEEEK